MNSCSTAAAAVGGRCEGIEDIDSLGEILDEVTVNFCFISIYQETFNPVTLDIKQNGVICIFKSK